jgi:hypothetical protein
VTVSKVPYIREFFCGRSRAAAAPRVPMSVMNSRRFTAQYLPCSRTKGMAHGGLLRCGISIRPMSALGQTRSFGDVGSMSGLPPKPERFVTACRTSARSGSQRLPRPSGLVLLRSQPALRVRAIPRADMNYVSRCRLRKQELSGALVDRAALLLALLWTDSLATWPCPAEADARPLA